MDDTVQREIVIKPAGNADRFWRDVLDYRELFLFLAWRDILVRYKQAVLGVLWCILRPVITMIVFTVVFGNLAKLPSGGIPYPVLVFAAILPWQFFAGSLSDCSNSLIANGNLLSKVYFPRIIIPVSSIMPSLVDLLVSGVVMVGLMAYYQVQPGAKVIVLPLLVAVAFFAALGAGLWCAALNVSYRDFRFIVPFMIQFGLFISPVGFQSSVVPERWQLLYSLNPMVGVIDGFRWAVSDGAVPLYLPGLCLSCTVTLILFVSGVWFFRRAERSFADLI